MRSSTPTECIAEAEKLLRTGNPTVAMLYMKKAERLLDETAWARMTDTDKSVAIVLDEFQKLGEVIHGVVIPAIQVVWDVMREAFGPINTVIDEHNLQVKEPDNE